MGDFDKAFYTVPQAAELLQLHENTVYKLIRTRQVAAYKIGKQYRIAAEELEKLRIERGNIMTIESNELAGIIETLKEARRAISPEAMNGDKAAADACDHLFDIFNALSHWEGQDVAPEDIDDVRAELQKVLDILDSPDAEDMYHADEAKYDIDRAITALESAAN